MVLAKRVGSIEESATLAVTEKARQMKGDGIDVLSLSAGEPDFDTPDPIKQAAIEAIQSGKTKYTSATGILELRKAIAKKLKDDNGLTYEPGQIVVSCGAKHALYNAITALVDDGDEVLVPAPYWTSYPEMVKAAGGVPVIIETGERDGFKIQARDLENSINSKTKVILLNSPSNPTGAVYTKEELQAIADVVLDTDLFVISDEIYEKLIYADARHVSIAALNPELVDRTIVVNGVSKTYAMTGWRIGYAAGPLDVLQGVANLQSQSTSNPCSIAQYAALSAVTGDQAFIGKMLKAYDERRRFLHQHLNALPGVQCVEPKGAFYAFPRVASYFGKKAGDVEIAGSAAFADALLEQGRVATVPGAAFGADDYIRLSYATSLEVLEESVNRIEAFLKTVR